MKQILFLTLIGFAACGVYNPQRRYPTNQYSRPSTQYGTPTAQYAGSSNQYSSPAAQQVPILRIDTNNNGDGTYSYAYETANGIAAQEQGDARGEGTRAQGGFSYTSPNGQPIQVQYSADENGFIPQGNHLPVALTGPILRSIQQNLAEERRGVVDDGQYRTGQNQGYGQQQQYSTPQKSNTAYIQQQQYAAPQKSNTAQSYVTPQKYNTPTRYTPQRYNTAQQYRAPQSTNTYAGSNRPQTLYKF